MHKLLLVGGGLSGLASGLSARGYKTSTLEFENLRKALQGHEESPVIILGHIEKSDEEIEDFFSVSMRVPKVIIRPEENQALSRWLREPLTYTLATDDIYSFGELLGRIEWDKTILEENLRLKEQNSSLEGELRFFEELSRAITSEKQEDVLLFLLEKIRERTQAETCTIFLLNDETGELVMEKTSGTLRSTSKSSPVKAGEGLVGWVQREAKPVLIMNVYKDTSFSQRLDREIRHKIRTLISVPIKSRSKILGVLELINKTDDSEFGTEDFANVLRFIDHVALVIERAILYEKMQELVITDDLTKLFNTRYMTRTIEGEVARSNRYRTSVSLIFMDIDYFKNVNDNYGHLVGSKILVEMAQLLIRHLRDVDIVARYGGDEFVIILPQTPPDKAVTTAERIREVVEGNVFLKKEGLNLKLTASFGVASYPEHAKSREDLLRLADEAMYKVKHRTRNGVYAIMQNGAV
jgi:diguanylate cyclase (GGDEF)-like protein